jgi:hypothetical protein
MKVYSVLLAVFIIACSQRENLNYPTHISEIKEVVLERPDEKSHGKFAEIRKLSAQEISELLKVLNDARPLGLKKFKIDYYIVFITNNGTRRIKISGNQIKGYDGDYTYKIEKTKALENFESQPAHNISFKK